MFHKNRFELLVLIRKRHHHPEKGNLELFDGEVGVPIEFSNFRELLIGDQLFERNLEASGVFP